MIVGVFLAVAGLVSLIKRLVRIGAVLLALAVILPILCSILWGDGDAYMARFASIFSPRVEEQIMDGYQAYKEKDRADPTVDYDQVRRYASDALSKAKEIVGSSIEPSDRVFSPRDGGR